MKKTYTKGVTLLLILLFITPIIGAGSYKAPIIPATAEDTEFNPIIPNINTAAFPNPGLNLGPALPAVLAPGESFTVILKTALLDDQGNTLNITDAYLLGVFLQENQLVVIRKPISYTILSYGNETSGAEINITMPSDATGGLYDLVFNLSNGEQLVLPRSIWILTSLGDVIRFIHMSDVHFGAGFPDEATGQQRRFTGYLMSSLLGVNMILDTGDEADTQASTQYMNSLSYRYSFAYNVPMFMAPGNHDYPNSNFIKYYEETVAYRVIGGKILVVLVNTDGELGHPYYETMVKIEQILENNSDIPYKIMLMHHPVFYHQGQVYINSTSDSPLLGDPRSVSGSIISYYWGGNITEAKWLLRLVEDYNVTLVLAGHIHRDQYVAYHSTRTNTTTLFQTTTTLSHGTGNYQGLQVDQLNLATGEITYPYAWQWFVGYSNVSRYDVYNSIPITKPEYTENWRQDLFGNTYFFGTIDQGSTGVVMSLENMYDPINISNAFVITLPWPENAPVNLQVLESDGGANITMLGYQYLPEVGRVAIALNMTLPAHSYLKYVLYTVEDQAPPTVELKRVLPRAPAINRTIKVFIDVSDEGWGVDEVYGTVTTERGEVVQYNLKHYSGSTYLLTFAVVSQYMTNVTINITAVDYAGHATSHSFTLALSGPEPPVETTTTTTQEQTSTTTTGEQTTTTTTTAEQTTEQTTTTTTQQTAEETTTSTTEEAGGNNTGVMIAIVVLILVIAGAAAVLIRK
ncbi:MAG: metallophosphoesterase [Desulfurococcales archaeon]|nr:metallophosphoesterase [Desulfurococcales archaeon]